MMDHIDLEARDPARNIWRYYTLGIERTLFNDYAVRSMYGRIGETGRHRCYHFRTLAEARHKYHQLLHKRLHAQSRIGVNYQVVNLSSNTYKAVGFHQSNIPSP